jgi:hypothetical protein
MRTKLSQALLWFQGCYFLLTGIWPLVDIHSFQWVTGPKTDHLVTGREGDHWLVMTVAVLVVAVSISLLVSAWNCRRTLEVSLLAVASAAGLLSIDLVYVARGVISPVYLLDATLEVLVLLGWLAVAICDRLEQNKSRGRSRIGEPEATTGRIG